MQTQDRPRFRQDLVAEPIDDAGARFIDVMDPDSGNVFRFYEVEYSLACAMDGERDVPGIVQWAKEELGLTPSANEVRTVIATLGDLGFIDAGSARPEALPPPPDDDYVRPGVVVGARRVATPIPDMELGNAGVIAPPPERPLPKSDIELGTGITAGPRQRDVDKTAVDDITLGVPGRVDVSVDLSDQMGVGVDDVKEAVRASQVMKAVDVPPELREAIEPDVPRPKAIQQPRPAERAIADTPRPMADVRPIEKRQPEPQRQPEPRREAQPDTSKRVTPVAPPAPAARVSPVLLVLLAIVVFGAIAFLVWKFAIKKADDTSSNDTKPAITQPKPPEPPPPPPPESQKLAAKAASTDSLKPVSAGTIEMIVAEGAMVKSGDVIAKLAGHKPIETEIANLERDIDKRVKPELETAQKERDAAQAAGNKAALAAAETRVADRQKSLDDKQGKLAQRRTDLDKLELKSPTDGKVAVSMKVGAKASPNDEVAVVTANPVVVATFKKADGGPKSRVFLVTKSDGKKLSCVVASADASGVTIECPADAAAVGTEVTFGGIDTTPPPATEIDMDSGSGAGSAGSGMGSSAAVPSPAPTRPTPPPHPARPTPHPNPHPTPTTGSGSAEPKPDTTPPAPTGSGSAS